MRPLHLIRLMRMGLEALQQGELHVRRPDAGELAAIRDGAWSFDAVLEQADALRERMTQAAARTRLPSNIDRSRVEALAHQLMVGPLQPPAALAPLT